MSEVVFDRRQEDHVRSLEEDLVTARLQLAACGVAALGNTEKAVAERINKGNPYWSASYGDVCGAVDREMQYRAEMRSARDFISEIRSLDYLPLVAKALKEYDVE
jgi:hypothetical protein